MGYPTPPLGIYVPPGNDCPTCFGAGVTPRWVIMTFGGIVKCTNEFCENLSAPPNGAFAAVQTKTHVCRYSSVHEGVNAAWLATSPAGKSSAVLHNPGLGEDYFYGVAPNNCATSFSNTLTCSGLPYDCYSGGGCSVEATNVNLVGWLQHTANFEASEDALNDTFEVEDETDQVVRIVNLKTPTNIKIRYSYP